MLPGTAIDSLTRLSVTTLSQYIRLQNCDRYLRFRLRPDEPRRMEHKWSVTVQPLTPLLRETGLAFERDVEDRLRDLGGDLRPFADNAPTTETLRWLRGVGEAEIGLQAPLEASINRFLLNGRADVVRARRDDNGRLHLYVADIKSSREARVEHRLQVAAYIFVLEQMLAAAGLSVASVQGGVIHAGDDGRLPVLDLDATIFDVAPYRTTLARLLLDDDSVVRRVDAQTPDDTFYHLGYWCDGCMFNAHCMWDSAERLDLSLVPGLTAMEKRTLLREGVGAMPDLAALMDLPQRGSGSYDLTPAAGHEETVTRLSNQWPLGPNLPLLVQRAKRALRRFDPAWSAPPFIFNGGFGSLPADAEHPNLVKIFFDAQHDYLQNRIYLLSTLITGPDGEVVRVRLADGPPTATAERELLLAWVQDILQAITQVAGATAVPVHLYCYNSYDQRMLLDALKRHLDAIALLPGFFDLMTQHPAVSQPIISFLFQEISERKNLGAVCRPLHITARSLGFDWSDDDHDYYRLFQARMFDNRRTIVRRHNGDILPAPPDVPRSDPRRASIESASRFNSQIPLEYAYGAWERLPDSAPEDRRLLALFRAVTPDHLRGFAALRVRALAHIEGSFRLKARFIDKPPVDLNGIYRLFSPKPSLAQSLREFLFMEHYAAFQQQLQVYTLPIERRVQTGLALLLRYAGHDAARNAFRFAIEFASIGLDPALALNAFRLKEGSWIVLNEAATSGSRIKNGRLGTIQAIGDDWIELDLLEITFGRGSRFRYYHKRDLAPQPGALYTLDEMADDMNADKALAALNHAEANTLYRWMQSPPAPRALADGWPERAQALLGQMEQGLDHPLTDVQREVIAGALDAPLLLVQGPPGTGKSYTLGWAVLMHILLRAAAGLPCRVSVSSKTHKAVEIVLASISEKWALLAGRGGDLPLAGGLDVLKIVNDWSDAVPDLVRPLVAYGEGAQLEAVLDQPYVVLGATPGGLYNVAKYRNLGGRQIEWEAQPFDLLVLDEASQMSQPEALLAAMGLADDGQMIVVGDHRQMPPIIAHDWEAEEMRSAVAAAPHLSLFEALLERGFPRLSLDQSFRLHETMARFLQDNIYVHDGIHFFSRRQALLPPAAAGDDFARAVLDPDYPIVVVEHSEQGSQQYNLTELALVAPLVAGCMEQLGLDGRNGLGIVVPHRAQKALLSQQFPALAEAGAIDTVERFQGGERDVIIVSATASDPDYVLAEADFLLNLNRLNVALSRPRQKLVVVASRAVTNLLTSDLDVFRNAVIWKNLYYQYASEVLWQGVVNQAHAVARGKHMNREGN